MNLASLFEVRQKEDDVWDLEEAEFNIDLMSRLYLSKGFHEEVSKAGQEDFLRILESPLFSPFPEVKKQSEVFVEHHGIFRFNVQLSSYMLREGFHKQMYMVQTVFYTQYGSRYNHIPPQNIQTKFKTFRNRDPVKILKVIKEQLVRYEKYVKDAYTEIDPNA